MTVDTTTKERWAAEDAKKSKFGSGTGIIETYSGEAYDFATPAPASINLVDIAHALSNMCRFAGHTRRFYSVAEHSVLVSRIVEARGGSTKFQAAALLHDAHEAYVWDCPKPLKPLLGDNFATLVERADKAISAALRIEHGPDIFNAACIKVADKIALCAERAALMTAGPDEWEPGYADVPMLPKEALRTPWDYLGTNLGLQPSIAKLAFLERAKELGVS